MKSNPRGLTRLSSGIPGLDTILNGGFFRGGLYLIKGTPGTGKTTLANQICFSHIARNERALYATLLSEYHARLIQYIGHMSFFDESKIPDYFEYLSAFGVLRKEGLTGLLALFRREILAKKVSMLIIDGLVAAQRVTNNDQSFNEFIHELQGIAIAADCTVFMVTSADRDVKMTPEHTMVDGILELSDHGFGGAVERRLQLTKVRGTDFLRGDHAYKISNEGISVYPRIEALFATPSATDVSETSRVTTGIAPLDAMLGGGLPSRSPTMLLGPAGTGKTTFGLQFLSACSAQEPGLLFGFYETPPRIIAKAQQVCRPLLPLLDSHAVEVLWQPPTHDSLDVYGDRLIAAVRRRGVTRLFIDGLGAFLNVPHSHERIRQYLPALTNELRALGVTTIHTLEARSSSGPDAQTTFGDLSLLAENLILLRYVELYSRLHRLISITKVRDSHFDHALRAFLLTENGPILDESSANADDIMRTVSLQNKRALDETPTASAD